MQEQYAALLARWAEISDLNHAAAVLRWDQTTYMPRGGGDARGRQLATLGRLAHEKLVDPEIGRLLDGLQAWADGLGYDSDEAGLLRAARREYERAVQVPAALMAQIFSHQAAAFTAWVSGRAADDFAEVQPFLERTVDLSRQYAECFPGYEHVADPLIDRQDPGMKASTIKAVFGQLRQELVPLVQTITAQPLADDSCVRQHFAREKQLAFGKQVVQRLGYDFARGREDLTAHPYTTAFSIGDVRITTRVDEHNLREALFGTIHESGHGMYEQGVDPAYEGTPLARGTSSGVHESQSRLWENLVGRSRDFWECFYPELQQVFPEQLAATPLDAFYRAVNQVKRSLIRTEADEVTYNLHVIIRFDLEMALLEGALAVRDLPGAWRARYESDLGITPPDDRDGVLQDTHWYSGLVGGRFQGYTLGNILGAQFFAAALQAQPAIPAQIRSGQFESLHTWLKENIYRYGRKYTADEVVRRATGQPLTIAPYIAYLKRKYGELYRLA